MQTCPKLNISYSRDFERIRVESTLSNAEWYRKNGYTVALPGNVLLSDLDHNPHAVDMMHCIDDEYDESFYKNVEDAIYKQWEYFEDTWPQHEIEKTTLQFFDTYTVYLTAYGVRGSYDIPNSVVINARLRNIDTIAKVIFHEIIHLSIEPFIVKYKIQHWYKERMVDLLYKKLFPSIAFEQNLPKEVLVLDSFFKNHCGDVEEILKQFATTHTVDET